MAQTRGLIISEKYVKDNSPIDNNVDMHLIRPVIWYCQKEYIEKALGTVFYDTIIAEIVTSGEVTTASYVTLVEGYVADMLLYYVMYEVQIPLLFKFRNKSTGKNTDPNQQPVELKEYYHLRGYYQKKAEYFASRLDDYLCYNSTTYPLWDDCSDGGVDARSTKSQTSLYLEGDGAIERIKYVNKYGTEL